MSVCTICGSGWQPALGICTSCSSTVPPDVATGEAPAESPEGKAEIQLPTAASPELGGGQVWSQPKFPYCTYYIVYVAGGDDQDWCRIHLPEHQGNIAATESEIEGVRTGGPLYSTEGMVALLDRLGYEYVGQYSDILSERFEASWTRCKALYAEPIPTTNSVLINDELVVEIRALREALAEIKQIVRPHVWRVRGYREVAVEEIARTALDQAKVDTEGAPGDR